MQNTSKFKKSVCDLVPRFAKEFLEVDFKTIQVSLERCRSCADNLDLTSGRKSFEKISHPRTFHKWKYIYRIEKANGPYLMTSIADSRIER